MGNSKRVKQVLKEVFADLSAMSPEEFRAELETEMDKTIDSFIRENGELLDSLANKIICPACKQCVAGPFYNLGETFQWAEGCQDCHKKAKEG